MQKIYQNFDGLDVSFQCAVPEYIRKQLEIAKLEAQETKKAVFAYIGPNSLQVAVAETGAKGGFTYRFSTGIDGATWFIVDNAKADGWNVRVSCNSLMLALYGYHETKQKLLDTLTNDLDAVCLLSVSPTGIPLERVSRFDYCFDFISNDFEPNPKHFIIHTRSTKSYLGNGLELPFSCIERGGKLETICIGKMPNRQVILYNKRKEIIAHNKSYWWDIWKLNKNEFKGEIWRIEIRAGKKELNKWNLRKFQDFENKCGDVIIHALKNNKYIIPNENDQNRSRWPLAKFWEDCINYSEKYLAEYICSADRKEIISDYKNNIINRYKKYFMGMTTSYTAVLDMDISEIPVVLDLVEEDIIKEIRENRKKMENKYKKAKQKYEFIN